MKIIHKMKFNCLHSLMNHAGYLNVYKCLCIKVYKHLFLNVCKHL